ALADQIRRLETYSIQRAITQPWQDAALLFADALPGGKPARRAAIDRAGSPWLLQDAVSARENIAAEMMLSLRKRKEEDEISEIRASLQLCATAYRTARESIAPGLTEIDIYNSLHAAINREAGTSVLFPGDFACGER